MSVARLARTDLRNAARSRMVRWLTAAFTLFSVLGVSLYALAGAGDVPPLRAVGALTLPAILLVPLAAVVVGYVAVVGERESGTLRFLLGFPVSRAAVVAAKVAGRAAVVAGTIAVAFAVAGGVVYALYGGFSLLRYAGFALATAGLGVAFVGLAVGVSAAVGSRGRALGFGVSGYFLLVLFWQLFVGGVHYVVAGALPGVEVPAWYLLLERLSPTTAYRALVRAALDTTPRVSLFSLRPPGASSAPVAEQLGGGPVPVYLSAPAAALVLALWVAVPTLVGYRRFRGSDL